jgi:hypothetical protein
VLFEFSDISDGLGFTKFQRFSNSYIQSRSASSVPCSPPRLAITAITDNL